MNHTQGPWEILRLDLVGDEVTCSVPVAIRGSNGRLVVAPEGGLAPEVHEWTVEEIEANAHLIAAAPDLLEAMELARQFLCNGIELGYIRLPDEGDPACETLNVIRAAIARARGKDTKDAN